MKGKRKVVIDSAEEFVDFPYIEDPEPYVTNRDFEDPHGDLNRSLAIPTVKLRNYENYQEEIFELRRIFEQTPGEEPEEAPEGTPPEETPEAAPEGLPPEEAPAEAAPEGLPPGEDPAAGQPGAEEPLNVDMAVGEQSLTSGEIGKAYELKKIYARLVSLESYLSSNIDTNLIELRNKISQAIQLFTLVISNFQSYKEKIDEIIIDFYKLIKVAYETLRNYYKENQMEVM